MTHHNQIGQVLPAGPKVCGKAVLKDFFQTAAFGRMIAVIDIHSHILPQVDDGARSLEESLEMARIAAEDGITRMIATPHAFNGLSDDPETDEILERVDLLQKAIGSEIELFPGNEIRYTDDIIGKAESGRLTTLNRQQYALIEFPTHHIPRRAKKYFRTLQEAGMMPILAHPERNHAVQRGPGLAKELIEAGVLIQITAMSVTGKFGDAALLCAETLLKHNAVHFIATDTHRPERRPPILSEARDAAAQIVGWKRAMQLVEENPRAVLEGKVIHPEPAARFEMSPTRTLPGLKLTPVASAASAAGGSLRLDHVPTGTSDIQNRLNRGGGLKSRGG